MKRFKVRKTDGGYDNTIVFNADTTQECYNYLLKQDMGLNSFMVECNVDDIEIDADEFMEAFREGECPMDLQFF
jgi:hypothetical protein